MLGLDPEKDEDFLYLAIERLATPLPEEWKPCITRE